MIFSPNSINKCITKVGKNCCTPDCRKGTSAVNDTDTDLAGHLCWKTAHANLTNEH